MEGTYSATELRKAIRDNDLETISEFIPDGINVDDFIIYM
jgi:citrate lyase synthetase